MTHPNPRPLAVTQSDREAAADVLGGAAPEGLLAGTQDSLSLVQAFARHRLATTKAAVSDSSAAGEACQQDREAAIEFATRYLYPNSSGVQRALAELLARHRTTAVSAETERCAGVALEIDIQGPAQDDLVGTEWLEGAQAAAMQIHAAIRAPSSGEA